MYFGTSAITGEASWVTAMAFGSQGRSGGRQRGKDGTRSYLEVIVAVPWRKKEDDAKMDGERLKGDVVMMDKNYTEKLQVEEHVLVPKRVHITREDLEVFGQRDVRGAYPCSRGRRDKRAQKTAEGGLKRS